MFAALEVETDRGRACVGDAMLDELFKELFSKCLIDRPKEVRDVLSGGQPLSNHGTRLRLAYLLGWIGPETYEDCRTIHRIRNKMAHELDVESFDNDEVRNLVDGLKSLEHITITVSGETKRGTLERRSDKFLWAVSASVMRL